MRYIAIFLFSAFTVNAGSSPFSDVDLSVKSYYGIIGIGYSRSYYQDDFKTGIDNEKSLLGLNNYGLSGKAGIYIPWLNRNTTIGLMANISYDRYYESRAFGNGAKSEVLSGTFGIDLAVYPLSAAGKGPYLHVLNGFSKIKYNTDFGYDGFSPYGYGLTVGTGIGIPWSVSYPEHLNLSIDFDYRKAGDKSLKTLNFYVSVGGFF
ncbi:hypothetical protein JXL83_01155 [candidate division WOR-3 bacterium]|nr:hypothetical protein [candidate division WOR-3 bacterium]